jgi:hypothetical protein
MIILAPQKKEIMCTFEISRNEAQDTRCQNFLFLKKKEKKNYIPFYLIKE